MINKDLTNDKDYDTPKDVPQMDYKAECSLLYKERSEQATIIKALVFYIQEHL